MIDLLKIKRIVDIEYKDIVLDSEIIQSKLRAYIIDGSFPKHFHSGTSENVIETEISDISIGGVREFMKFIKQVLDKK